MNAIAIPVIVGLGVGAALLLLFLNLPIPYEYNGPGNDVMITLRRTACFGDCPVYSLEIYGNGFVVFRQVTDPGLIYDSHVFGLDVSSRARPHVYQVPVDEVQGLLMHIDAIDYFSLNNSYIARATDLPATITSVTVNGTTKGVYNYVAGPQELYELEYKIDDVARVRDWVEDYDNRMFGANAFDP